MRIKCQLYKMNNILKNKGFEITDKFDLYDLYFVENNIEVKKENLSKLLSDYILIRNVKQFVAPEYKKNYVYTQLVSKHKQFSADNTIVSQSKSTCEIKDEKQGIDFLKSIGYKKIVEIKQKIVEYKKDDLIIETQSVENQGNLIEVETTNSLDTIDKLKQKIKELELPVYKDNYFINKEEVELNRIFKGE